MEVLTDIPLIINQDFVCLIETATSYLKNTSQKTRV